MSCIFPACLEKMATSAYINRERQWRLLMLKYGLELRIPGGASDAKQDGLAERLQQTAFLFDSHDDMLIFDRPPDSDETLTLLAVPAGRVTGTNRFADFAFVSRERRFAYFDLDYAACFRLTAHKPDAEPAPALMQLEEHLIAAIADRATDQAWHVIERHLAELAERVARAYGCDIEWLAAERL